MNETPGERELRALLTLFTFERKRDLEAYARRLVVRTREFVDVVLACQQGLLPLSHRAQYNRHQPMHLVPSNAELKAVAANGVGRLQEGPRKTVMRLGHLFRESHWSAGHMFYTAGLYEWHLFIFGRRDEAENPENHWTGGPHLHFVNWLWTGLDPRALWLRFVEDDERPSSALHIRHEPSP
jgi:hypothetical protein